MTNKDYDEFKNHFIEITKNFKLMRYNSNEEILFKNYSIRIY